jgi:hypothetical protein
LKFKENSNMKLNLFWIPKLTNDANAHYFILSSGLATKAPMKKLHGYLHLNSIMPPNLSPTFTPLTQANPDLFLHSNSHSSLIFQSSDKHSLKNYYKINKK